MAFALCSCIATVTAWASGQIQITGIDVTQEGYLQITRNGNEPMTVWVRYPGQAAWTPVGKNITAATWVSPVTDEVAQIRIKPYSLADDVYFPSDPPSDEQDVPAPTPDGDAPTDDDAIFPANDAPTGGDAPLPPGNNPDNGGVSFPAGGGGAFFASDTPPKNNQAKATPDPGAVKIYWHNSSSRQVACWGLTATGTVKSAEYSSSASMAAGWELKGAGDINRDGTFDLLWHNSNSRRVAYWLMAKDGFIESSGFCNDGGMAAGWELKGVGDINRDGTVDLLWHNSNSRRVAYWLLNADGSLAEAGFCNDGGMAAGWELKGVGDINRDGTVDLLWHNSNSRRVAYWLLNQDGSLAEAGFCNDGGMAAGWELKGVGDINNDGTVDLLWHNSKTRRVAYWLLNTNGSLKTSGFCNDGAMAGGWILRATGI